MRYLGAERLVVVKFKAPAGGNAPGDIGGVTPEHAKRLFLAGGAEYQHELTYDDEARTYVKVEAKEAMYDPKTAEPAPEPPKAKTFAKAKPKLKAKGKATVKQSDKQAKAPTTKAK